MGGSSSSLSPSDSSPTEEILFRCMKPMDGWWLVTPCVSSEEEMRQHIVDEQNGQPAVTPQFLELSEFKTGRLVFQAMRNREDIKGADFSVMFCMDGLDTRFYPIHTQQDVDVYMCEQIHCPSHDRLHGMAGVVVVIEKREPRDNPLRSFGDMIFGTIVGDTEKALLPRRRFWVCTFGEDSCVDMISSSQFTVTIEHVE